MVMVTEQDFTSVIGSNLWRLVDEKHPLKLYIGKDAKGRCALEYVGNFVLNKSVKSSALLEIMHYKLNSGEKSMVLSLSDNAYLKQFCIFCNDLIESTSHLNKNTSKGYDAVCSLYFTWQKLFRSQNEILSETEIKGLIGELMFLETDMLPKYEDSVALLSWTGPDFTKKDFSLEDTWYEIKTVDFGKNTVQISSIEQLDSSKIGTLVVYQVEKMAPEYQGVSLNVIVKRILEKIESLPDKDLFLQKLRKAKYSYSPLYDEYVYEVRQHILYRVDETFPKLVRERLGKAIAKATYELNLSEIYKYRI